MMGSDWKLDGDDEMRYCARWSEHIEGFVHHPLGGRDCRKASWGRTPDLGRDGLHGKGPFRRESSTAVDAS